MPDDIPADTYHLNSPNAWLESLARVPWPTEPPPEEEEVEVEDYGHPLGPVVHRYEFVVRGWKSNLWVIDRVQAGVHLLDEYTEAAVRRRAYEQARLAGYDLNSIITLTMDRLLG